MAFVQGAHRGDETEDAVFMTRGTANLLHPGNGADDFHLELFV